jgi:spectinomycin phosphotransferase
MITENADIERDTVLRALRSEWDVDADDLEFLPVGGDSWSYRAGDLFVNVREALGQRKPWSSPRDIEQSLRAAIALRHRCGLEFLLTPRPTTSDQPLVRLGRYAVTVFPFLDGAMSYDVSTRAGLDAEIASWIDRLHAATHAIADMPLASEDFTPDFSGGLRRALERASSGNAEGPYASRLVALMQSSRETIAEALDLHEAHGARLRMRDCEYVVTHGEPSGNVLLARNGAHYLIDLVELKRAPRERDLQDLPAPPGAFDEDLVSFYKQDFVLNEIAEYADRLSLEHVGDDEDDRAWDLLGEYVEHVRKAFPQVRSQ